MVPANSVEQPQRPYQYSYIMNAFSLGIQRYQCCLISSQSQLSAVRHPSEKIMLIEGNEATMIDGVWVPPPNVGSYINDLGDRHNRYSGQSGVGRGNVVFADTHVEFVTPAFVHDPAHYLP
jgi:prepilin-type processing-associated H-X9-DG protein